MSWTTRIYRKFRSSDGRIKIATLFGVLAVAALAVLVGVLPAIAGPGLASDAGVEPTEIAYGGGSGACASIGSPYDELHINNPTSDTFETADGEVQVDITVDDADEEFSYSFVDPTLAAFQVIVNGGKKNTVFDNQAHGEPLTADGSLHAPTKGNSLTNNFKLSHINICYGVFIPNVEGTKYHDRDTDGELDETEEEGLGGWTIAAFDDTTLVAKTMTADDGSYTLGNLGAHGLGPFTICEETNTEGLPDDGPGFTWAWTQSEPQNTDCSGLGPYEPGGHSVTLDDPAHLISGQDFGNHIQASVNCGGPNPVTVTLGGEETDDTPLATLTFPPECDSGTTTFSFDVGLSDPDDPAEDPDDYRQVVIVGLDAADLNAEVVGLTIEWDAEEAVYVNGGDPSCIAGTPGCSLLVPTTQVLLDLGGVVPDDLEPATFCNTNADLPDLGTPQCLDSRTIAEGGDLPEGYIQLTEDFLLFGDPGSFR